MDLVHWLIDWLIVVAVLEHGYVFYQGIPRTSSLQAPIMLLTGHGGEIFCCKFHPDGSALASAGYDRQICTWIDDVVRFSCICNEICRYSVISRLTVPHFFADLWNVFGESENYAILPGHKGAILDLQFSRDGRYYDRSIDWLNALKNVNRFVRLIDWLIDWMAGLVESRNVSSSELFCFITTVKLSRHRRIKPSACSTLSRERGSNASGATNCSSTLPAPVPMGRNWFAAAATTEPWNSGISAAKSSSSHSIQSIPSWRAASMAPPMSSCPVELTATSRYCMDPPGNHPRGAIFPTVDWINQSSLDFHCKPLTWLVYWIRTAWSVFTGGGAGLKWPNTAGQYNTVPRGFFLPCFDMSFSTLLTSSLTFGIESKLVFKISGLKYFFMIIKIMFFFGGEKSFEVPAVFGLKNEKKSDRGPFLKLNKRKNFLTRFQIDDAVSKWKVWI